MKTSKFFQVSYTKRNGQESTMVVKARTAKEAIGNAKNVCFTGRNFSNPVEISKTETFASTHKGCGSNRI